MRRCSHLTAYIGKLLGGDQVLVGKMLSAGLLHDLGALMLCYYDSDEYANKIALLSDCGLMLGCALKYLGYSLNSLSLFALVLAVGIVVDDAIVVVEAVERNIKLGMTPREAAYRTMDEVSGALIAIGLVLLAVFVPTAFMPGIPGMFFRQFAVTIAAASVISLIVSLTLSPALAAILLKPHVEHEANSGPRWMKPIKCWIWVL